MHAHPTLPEKKQAAVTKSQRNSLFDRALMPACGSEMTAHGRTTAANAWRGR